MYRELTKCSKILQCLTIIFVTLSVVVPRGICLDEGFRNETEVAVRRINKRDVLDETVASYLAQFGYMDKSAGGAHALRTEESVRDAVRELQAFAGIPVTGKVDERTLTLMQTPRCGVADREKSAHRVKRYQIHGYKWPHTDLTWSLRTKYFQELDYGDVRMVISRALAVWSKHSRLTFREVDDDQADIRIYFHRREHGDNFPFDGRGIILAHAFFPTGVRAPVDVHFDADENWTTSESNNDGTNLFNVAAHEIGHSLGLSHSNEEGALMYPWYKEIKDGFNYELPEDDRMGIQALYGTRERQYDPIPHYPRARPTTTTTTTTTRPTPKTYPTKSRWHKPSKRPKWPKPGRPHHFPETSTSAPRRYYPPPRYPTARPETPNYPPKETPRRTNHYGSEDIPPDSCDTSYDAVSLIRNELYIFKGKYFWRIDDKGQIMHGRPVKIIQLFRGFRHDLTHVDAVYEKPSGEIVFFVGKEYYLFDGGRVKPGYPQPLTRLGLPSSLRKLDGAMVWGWNSKTYFFSGDLFWRFDEKEQKVELDYPRDLEKQWKGIPSDIDAVFQWKDGKTYFFKDRFFWKLRDYPMGVENAEPKLSAPFWMGCKSDNYDNNVHQKLPYTLESSSNSGKSHSIVLVCVAVLSIWMSSLFVCS